MEYNLVEEEIFDKINFTENLLPKGDYEYCTFINCDFSNSDLSDIRFKECKFIDCNLSMVNLSETILHDIKF